MLQHALHNIIEIPSRVDYMHYSCIEHQSPTSKKLVNIPLENQINL